MKKMINAFNGNASKAVKLASAAKVNAAAKNWFASVDAANGDTVIYGMGKNEDTHIMSIGNVHLRNYVTVGKTDAEIAELDSKEVANDFESIRLYLDREIPVLKPIRKDEDLEFVPVMTNTINVKLSDVKRVADNITRRAIASCIAGQTVDFYSLQGILEGASVAFGYTSIKSGDQMRGTTYTYEHDFTKVALYGLEINDAIHASYEAEFADADAERREKVVADSTADLMARFLAARAARNEK